MSYNGIINVYKEAGFTSFDVVAKLRGMLKTKKIGHTGTLDPEAVGVLPVCLGSATKVCELLMDDTKEYIARVCLGVVTDTQDMTGEILESHPDNVVMLTDETINNALSKYKGEIEQIPPMYSALKVNGQKLYDLARKGIEVERKKRKVTIFELEVIDGLHKVEDRAYITIRVVCSKGTYIRTICHDLGQDLGCGGAMEHLERTRVGVFGKESALTLGEIQKLVDTGNFVEAEDGSLHNTEVLEHIIPVDVIFDKYPPLHVTEEGMKALNNGNQLQINQVTEVNDGFKLVAKQVYRIYSYDNQFRALYEYHSGWKVLKTLKMF